MPKKRQQSVLIKPSEAADAVSTKAIDSLRREVQGRSFTDGTRLLEDIDLVDGTNRIAHGLGRRPKGWLVVGRRNVTVAAVSEQRVTSPTAFTAAAPASVTPPDGATDYWTFNATTRIAGPLMVSIGETITGVAMYFYRGQATEPTVRILGATTGASGDVLTPTVAWSSTTLNTWVLMSASYSGVVTSAKATLDITGRNLDRMRQCIVTVSRTPDSIPELYDVHDVKTDVDKFLYLVADGFTATVDLLVF